MVAEPRCGSASLLRVLTPFLDWETFRYPGRFGAPTPGGVPGRAGGGTQCSGPGTRWASAQLGLDDLEGFFQPQWFCDSSSFPQGSHPLTKFIFIYSSWPDLQFSPTLKYLQSSVGQRQGTHEQHQLKHFPFYPFFKYWWIPATGHLVLMHHSHLLGYDIYFHVINGMWRRGNNQIHFVLWIPFYLEDYLIPLWVLFKIIIVLKMEKFSLFPLKLKFTYDTHSAVKQLNFAHHHQEAFEWQSQVKKPWLAHEMT